MRERMANRQLREALRLYLVMGSMNVVQDPAAVLQGAILGGVTLFQYREKGLGARMGKEKYRLGKELQKICKAHQVLFIVNDDVDLALELDADGVHVGQEDEAAIAVRSRIGSNKILGVSAHTLEEARWAISHGANYLGVGPMYPTQSKADAREVQGPSIIKELREHGISIPLVGIGGIGLETAEGVIRAGADGVAVISAISLAASPQQAASGILHKVIIGSGGALA